MKIKFSNIEKLLQQLQGDEDINIDNLNVIEPIGIALLKLHAVSNPTCQIIVSGHGVYNLAALLSGEADTAREYTPLAHFDNTTTNMDDIANDVTEIIISNTTDRLELSDQKDLALYLNYLISEMMDNVTSHSLSTYGGFIAAQYYASSNKVQVVIVDNGVGLLKSLSSHFTLASEQEAISKAKEKEVTGSNAFDIYTQVQKHAGLGLFFLSEILKRTKGRYLILSNDTVYRSAYQATHVSGEESFQEIDTSFTGTMIAFEIYEEGLEYEFSQLFGMIRDEDADQAEEEDIF